MDEFEKFYNKALRFLSYRPRSEKEIRDNLAKKKIPPKIAGEIVAKLKEQNFINDEEFAKWWTEQRNAFKPRAIKLIKIELKQKGISGEIIEKIIQNSESIIQNDLESAKKLVQKKINKYKNLPKEEIYQKLGRFLGQKGFNWGVIKQSIDEVLETQYNVLGNSRF